MVQLASSFVATVLLVAPVVLAAPVPQDSFEARDRATGARGISRFSLPEGSHRPSSHRLSHESTIGSHRGADRSYGFRSGNTHRPAPLNLGASRRLGGREDAEEIEEFSTREPFTGRNAFSGGLSPPRLSPPLRSNGGSRSHFSSHSDSGAHTGAHRSSGFGYSPSRGSARLGSSRRLGGREDIEDVEELAAREPFVRPMSGGFSPSHRAMGVGHFGSQFGGSSRHFPSGFGSARLGASRRLGGREVEDAEELAAREPLRPFSGGFLPGGRPTGFGGIGSIHGSSHAEGRRIHTGGMRSFGDRPTGLRRLGGRENIEDVDELAARDGLWRSSRVSAHESASRFGPHLRPHSASVRPTGKFALAEAKARHRFASREDVEELMSRDFEELSERDLEEIEELAARDPSVKEWFDNLGKKIKNFFVGKKKPATPAPAAADAPAAEAAVAARSESVEMTELLGREVDLD